MKATPSAKEMIAFKIGARARKFLLEDCPVEGYEILMTALAESEIADPPLNALLKVEMEKYERRVAAAEAADASLQESEVA
jgi:Asp-tRNA(Asn)/Glu-tRNA(Gln) amidotransferase A subunit family amidase